MTTSSNPVVSRTYLHSCYVRDIGRGDDAVTVSEILEYADGTTQPNLAVWKNPKVPVWITQEAWRIHPDKKEFEHVKYLDEHRFRYNEKDRELFKLMNNGWSPNYINPKQRNEIYTSPYVYGANIDVEALIAMHYKANLKKDNKIPQMPTTGFFDIERSLLPESEGKLPLISYVTENKVFLAMKRSFMYETRNGVENVPVALEDIIAANQEHIVPLVQELFDTNEDLHEAKHKLPFEFYFHVADTEVEMLRWVFAKIHETKASFIGVWNIGFDIPTIMEVLEQNGVDPEELFCDPQLLSQGIKRTHYKEDKRDVAHFTQKWHWLSTTSASQFVDSMSLYSYIRTVEGKDSSYGLGDILTKHGLGGKLKIGQTPELEALQTADWHREMLKHHFVNYALYTIWDSMGLQLMEWINKDMTAMMVQADITPVRFFPNQTIGVTNTMYEEKKAEGYILGTGKDIEASRDEDQITMGGAVLEPLNLIGKGIKLIKEWPSMATRFYAWVSDVDFSGLYPNCVMLMNISKQTKVATMFAIKGDRVDKKYSPESAVESFCSYLITPDANGVELGTEFFALKGYNEMDEAFKEHLMQKAA